MVTLSNYLFVSLLLFTIGFAGAMLLRNILIILMSLELMLNGRPILSLVAFSRFRISEDALPNYNAQVFVFFIITVAAAEVAVGLGDHRRALLAAPDDPRGSISPDLEVLDAMPSHLPWTILLAPELTLRRSSPR